MLVMNAIVTVAVARCLWNDPRLFNVLPLLMLFGMWLTAGLQTLEGTDE